MPIPGIPSNDDSDVIDGLLEPEGDEPFIFNVPDEENDEAAQSKARLETLERENAALKAQQSVRPQIPSFEEGYRPPQAVSQPQTQHQVPQLDQAALNKQIEADLFSGNALGVFQKFNAAAVELATQNAQKQLTPLKASMVRQQVSYFKQNANMEPEVAKEFDQMVKQYRDEDLANVDPSALPDILLNMKRIAFSKAYEEGHINPQPRRAPMYGGSGGSASGVKGQKSMKLTTQQKEAVRIAREDYGWDDKMIYEALKNGDLDG